MKFKKSLLGTMISMAVTTSVLSTGATASNIVSINDLSHLKEAGTNTPIRKSSANYIVQLKGASGVAKAAELGELLANNQKVALGNNKYNGESPRIAAYTNRLKAKQAEMAANFGSVEILHSYVHTFNGFAAKLSGKQAEAMKNHPDVVGVWEDEVFQPQTANTPAFLGLAGPSGGLHADGVDGEGVIVGILDTGIIPEHPSFADDGTYTAPAGWLGTCDAGEEAAAGTFACNNKLIGARFFNSSFKSSYALQPGEFESPRDADGHGSHTASTAAGNAGVAASRNGLAIADISGIAPRAHVAMYKVCWNSSYEDPVTGTPERGCFFGDSMAAIDQAVMDGVDVLNYSIGNSSALNTPVYNASLSAAEAGVFFAGSAGNSGAPTDTSDGSSTVSNIAPWITTVAASTYDGPVSLSGKDVQLTLDTVVQTPVFSIPAGFGPKVGATGLTGNLVTVEDFGSNTGPGMGPGASLACDANPITNAAGALTGNIALISRGGCAFTEKVHNAQEAGAAGVIIYSTAATPFAMGGSDPLVTIPSVMVSRSDGEALFTMTQAGNVVATLSDVDAQITTQEVGNIMAGFSSRGPNTTPQDIIKPDITAPGVQILAATSNDQLDIPGNVDGENFDYLSGTSMSGPHIAGIAALLKGENSGWSPAQIKSAIMTSARQNLTKPDGLTPADPFNFGSGHTDPLASLTPGLSYDANINDYLAFLCGQGESTLVADFGTGSTGTGQTCATLMTDGFATDPSQLNYPSIAISALTTPEEIFRTVTDMTGAGGTYTATIEAPAGIGVVLRTFDATGAETPTQDLVVDVDGKASYSLTFSKLLGFVPGEFTFGAITFTAADGTEVRSPIAINPESDVNIVVPPEVGLTMNSRGRASFFVEMLYSGRTSITYSGLSAPEFVGGSVEDSMVATGSRDFNFNRIVATRQYHIVRIPEGTQVARFDLIDDFVAIPGTDLDLYVYSCLGGLCDRLGVSASGGSDEQVILVNPDTNVDFHLMMVHGWSLGNDANDEPIASTTYQAPIWVAAPGQRSTSIRASSRAIEGRYNNIYLNTRGLGRNLYMGGVTFFNGDGEAEGTTVLEVFKPN